MNRLAMLALAAAFALPAGARAQEASPSHPEAVAEAHDHDAHVAMAADLRLIHAWSRATDSNEALVFLEIENHGTTAAALTGGESANASTVEVVGFQLQGGTGSYLPLGEVPIAANSVMTLAPEGVALRLGGLSHPLHEGETFPMEIHLGEHHVDVTVEIEAPDAHQHSHAGHKH